MLAELPYREVTSFTSTCVLFITLFVPWTRETNDTVCFQDTVVTMGCLGTRVHGQNIEGNNPETSGEQASNAEK